MLIFGSHGNAINGNSKCENGHVQLAMSCSCTLFTWPSKWFFH